MTVEIYFHNLDIETKLAILEENNIDFLDDKAFYRRHNYEYSHYLNQIADNHLNTDSFPIAIYEIEDDQSL